MARHELSIEHLKKPAHQVIALIIKAIEKKVRRQRWLMLLQHHSKLDANTAPLDPEALHDFRVELRRLRVWLAQSRDCVATRRAARSQLRALAKMSNAPRDTEVFLSLLAKIPADAPKLLPATAPPAPNSHPTPLALIPELAAPLPVLAPRRRKQKSRPFGLWLAQHLRDALHQSDACFNGDEACLHAARIHIKHLRYLIEPFAAMPQMAEAIGVLKSLQTTLGDLHDLFMMRQLLAPSLGAQLIEALNTLTQQPEVKTRQIQQVFNPARDQFICALNWQKTQYQTALNLWQAQESSHRHALNSHINALIDWLTEQTHGQVNRAG
ncbi:MAG TPA: CHAD domain-containing protein [Halothiobacillus sp.]|nr:CHAD domain-containing protein [Halothiobacillus sp.]